MEKIKLLGKTEIDKILLRLSHEIIEKNSNMANIAIVGIRTRGDFIAKRILKNINEKVKKDVKFGTLDVTFYRDDFRTNLGTPEIGPSNITFDLNDLNVILVDDVLYTGRTIRAAMDELFSFGRPASIQLCVLVDRGHRELPIKANFIGKNFPTAPKEHIDVCIKEVDKYDEINLKKY